MRFTKMEGLGNDFVVIDNRQTQSVPDIRTIQRLSDRRTGIGFDQMLVVSEASVPEADFDYRIFNADGEEVEHCGNGARCFARYVTDRQLIEKHEIVVNTLNGLLTLHVRDDGNVTVAMGVPKFAPADIPFDAQEEALFYDLGFSDQQIQVGACSIGNPHVLLRVDDVSTAPVEQWGPLIENHPAFPRRVNVGFMQVLAPNHIRLRVFERGVGETRACGSGACAAVAIAHRQGILDNSAVVTLPGGDLQILWKNIKSSIEMTGPCSTVFEGQTTM